MNDASHQPDDRGAIDRAAAQWVLRHDRGLSATEQDEFSQWLAADSRHGPALAVHRWGWDELDRLAGLQSSVDAIPDPDLLVRRPVAPVLSFRRLARRTWLPLAAAAAIALAFGARNLFQVPAVAPEAARPPVLARIEQRTLEDGSVIELNRGAVVAVHYTPGERRVELVRGEAHFTVAKNPARPFIVSAAGVDVRAVGTAFNVRLDAAAVEVLVTEGHVQVTPPAAPALDATMLEMPELFAGQSTLVSLTPVPPPPQIATVTAAEIAQQLAWQPRLLDFTGAPLADIVAEFNRGNPLRLVIEDPALAALRLSASFRSDNVEGFVRLMESDFGMRLERRGPSEIVLRRSK